MPTYGSAGPRFPHPAGTKDGAGTGSLRPPRTLEWKRSTELHPHLEDPPRPPDQTGIPSEARHFLRKLKMSDQETIS